MIKNFADHSANERTYLAWIRTAIAVMAFGFLIEKFNLFLVYLGMSVSKMQPSLITNHDGQLLGLALILLGLAMIVIATARFVLTERQIDSDDRQTGARRLPEILLGLLLTLLGAFLLLYLVHLMMR